MRTFLPLLAFLLLISSSGCATAVRMQEQPEPRGGVSLISDRPLPDLAVRVNGQDVAPAVVYGSDVGGSPFVVYRVPVGGSPRTLDVEVTLDGHTSRYEVAAVRGHSGMPRGLLGLLLGQGLWSLVDRASGAYRAYPDIVLRTNTGAASQP